MNLFLKFSIFLIYLYKCAESQAPNHTNNWAVIVDTSRFWFNYRHAANVLSIYRSVKRLGIPDRLDLNLSSCFDTYLLKAKF